MNKIKKGHVTISYSVNKGDPPSCFVSLKILNNTPVTMTTALWWEGSKRSRAEIQVTVKGFLSFAHFDSSVHKALVEGLISRQ